MTSWWNNKLMKWLVDEITSLKNAQVHKMTGWWNYYFKKWLFEGIIVKRVSWFKSSLLLTRNIKHTL